MPNKRFFIRQLILQCGLAILFCGAYYHVFAQVPTDSLPRDPAKISVYVVQNLQFGALAPGNAGGTVTISPAGQRTTTGSVIALNRGGAALPAIFEVEAPAGMIIALQNGADAPLTGSNGGTMTLRLGTSSPVSPFTSATAPPGRTQVTAGGTLTLGNATITRPGTYSGQFSILFFQP